MNLLGFDTATPATAVAVLREDGEAFEARHDPPAGERPGHATRLLGLVEQVLAEAGLDVREIDRLAVGTGPGSFTGLRIGIATARGLAQAAALELVGVSTLRVLAEGALAQAEQPVAAVIDARRGEAFAAAWAPDRQPLLEAAALAPDELARSLAALPASPLAVGDGALRFRTNLEPAGAAIPPDGNPLHRVNARHVCGLGAGAERADRDAVLPEYLRLPDAEEARRQKLSP